MLTEIRPTSKPPRALFYCWQLPAGKALVLFDRDGRVSITNDAEAVVANVLSTHPDKRILYRDTIGDWAELLHDGKKFIGFKPRTHDDVRTLGRL